MWLCLLGPRVRVQGWLPLGLCRESAFDYSDNHIHTSDDTIKYLSFDHMLQHARMTLALVYELGFTDFEALKSENEMGEL